MRKLIAAAVIPAAAAAVTLASTAASASTPGCSATAFCGSQQVTPQDRNDLMMAVTNRPGIGTRVVVKLASAANPSEDFLQYNPPVTSDNAKVFKYAPNGLTYTGRGFRGGLCATVSSDAVRALVVLEPCTNARSQQFVAQQDGDGNYYWVARLGGFVLTDPNGGPAGTQLQTRNYWDGPNQLWLYVAAPAV